MLREASRGRKCTQVRQSADETGPPGELRRTPLSLCDVRGLGPGRVPGSKMGIYGVSPLVGAQALNILHETSEHHSFPRSSWMDHKENPQGLAIPGPEVVLNSSSTQTRQ